VKLKDIIEGLDTIDVKGSYDIEVSSITADSRTVSEGSAFFAVPGETADGHDYIDDAIGKGATVIVREQSGSGIKEMEGRTFITVEDTRDALASCSARFYGEPSMSMDIIGITGTNGKTTTSYIIRHILAVLGKRSGLIGTIQYMTGEETAEARYTTPEAPEYQRLLAEMHDSGCEYVVSEVSSHALALKRVDHTRFSRAVFTNLTRDHLDFHKTAEQYLEAKKRLFTGLLQDDGVAVINVDDPASGELMKDIRNRIITYAVSSHADVSARDIVQDFDGMSMKLYFDGREYNVRTGLIGIPNVYNILAAVAVAYSLNIPTDKILNGISTVPPVRGRFETMRSSDGVLFIIDYAHTPDALRGLLDTVSALPHKKIITVFGCGGNRDRGKRPLMGKIASDMSDMVVITSDNPRYEDPDDIIREIESGLSKKNHISLPERADAVKEAVRLAKEGDVVVVAGKGHEHYQDIKGVRYHLDDRELVTDALRGDGRI